MLYAFGGGELPTNGFVPIKWIAPQTRNNGINKRALLDLLELMQVEEWKTAKSARLTYTANYEQIYKVVSCNAISNFLAALNDCFVVEDYIVYNAKKLNETIQENKQSEHYNTLEKLVKSK